MLIRSPPTTYLPEFTRRCRQPPEGLLTLVFSAVFTAKSGYSVPNTWYVPMRTKAPRTTTTRSSTTVNPRRSFAQSSA